MAVWFIVTGGAIGGEDNRGDIKEYELMIAYYHIKQLVIDNKLKWDYLFRNSQFIQIIELDEVAKE